MTATIDPDDKTRRFAVDADRELVAKYAGLLATVEIIAGMSINPANDSHAAATAHEMKRIAAEAAKNGR